MKIISLRYFEVLFKKQNSGFSQPSVDECVECLVYVDHKKVNRSIGVINDPLHDVSN